eukprot:SAG22_NODE_6317_length_871_cov_0.937824_1_plen_193_part_10
MQAAFKSTKALDDAGRTVAEPPAVLASAQASYDAQLAELRAEAAALRSTLQAVQVDLCAQLATIGTAAPPAAAAPAVSAQQLELPHVSHGVQASLEEGVAAALRQLGEYVTAAKASGPGGPVVDEAALLDARAELQKHQKVRAACGLRVGTIAAVLLLGHQSNPPARRPRRPAAAGLARRRHFCPRVPRQLWR